VQLHAQALLGEAHPCGQADDPGANDDNIVWCVGIVCGHGS